MEVTTDWIIGFALCLLAKASQACAVQTFARAHEEIRNRDNAEAQEHVEAVALHQVDSRSVNQSPADSSDNLEDSPSKKSYLCDTCWLIGLLCSVISGVSDILALGYAPASLIAPMGALTLIFNMCLNPIINGESVARYTIIATLVICCGTVITVVFSPRGNTDEGHDIGEELENIYISWNFAGFSIFITILISALWFTTSRWKDNVKVYSLAVPALSGTLSAVNRTIGKGMSIGLKLTFRGDGCFCVEWLWYIIFIGIFLSLFAHLKWLNRGLAAFSPVHIIPISSTCSILVATIAGMVVFREAEQFSGLESIILFSFGILVIVCGVVALALVPDAKDKAKRDDTLIDPWLFVLSRSLTIYSSLRIRRGTISITSSTKSRSHPDLNESERRKEKMKQISKMMGIRSDSMIKIESSDGSVEQSENQQMIR